MSNDVDYDFLGDERSRAARLPWPPRWWPWRPRPAPPPVPVPPPAPPPGPDRDVTALLNWHNDFRISRGVASLTLNEKLTAAAQWMSEDMARYQYMNHKSHDGRDPFTRMRDFGYTYTWAGENIAMSQANVAAVCDAWKASPGHRSNMLNIRFRECGFGVARDTAGQPYWTACFGSTMMTYGAEGPKCAFADFSNGAFAFNPTP